MKRLMPFGTAHERRALVRFGLVAAVLLVPFLTVQRQWYRTGAESDPLLGVNFSCKRTQYLGLDCRQALAAVLDDLGARSVRLSVYWSDVEQAPGQYDWSAIDWQLDELQARGARAVVTIGMKAQRYPEYWLPTWLRLTANIPPQELPEDHPLVRQHLLPYLDAAARHLSAHPAVEALQVENEPYVNYRPNRLLRLIGREEYSPGPDGRKSLRILFLTFNWNATVWRIREEFLAEEVATVRAAAPGKPIVLNHASWVRVDRTWRSLIEMGDVLGQSVYTKRQQGMWPWLYIFPYQLGPLSPDLPGQARVAAERGKELWLTELQAEPFEKSGVDERRLSTHELNSFSPRWLAHNLQLARRSGATRVYLWGVEWWLYLRERRDDARLWDAGRRLWAPEQAPAPASDRTDAREPAP
jgi:hypothetical protein